ncbi:MAG: DsrE family protein [Thermovirgaceae bacterium]|nr:DsrE family protein [Thermovirgaceae bacterium]
MKPEVIDELLVVWTCTEKETVENMVFLYTLNSRLKEWWGSVTLLIWGASARMAAEDTTIQEQLTLMNEAGVRVIACKKCAENLGVAQKLEALGIEVFYTGEFLTEWIKSGKKVLTF